MLLAQPYGDNRYSTLFGGITDVDRYFAAVPAVAALFDADFVTARELADRLSSLAGAIVGIEAVGMLAILDDAAHGEFFERAARIAAMTPRSTVESRWVQYYAATSEYNKNRVAGRVSSISEIVAARDAALESGVLDVAWVCQERLMLWAFAAGDVQRLNDLIDQLHETMQPDRNTTWKAASMLTWAAQGRGEQSAVVLPHARRAFEAMEEALREGPIRKGAMVETLADIAEALSESNVSDMAERVVSFIEAHRWHGSLDEWHGKARLNCARLYARHGRISLALQLIDGGLDHITMPILRLRLLTLRAAIVDVTGDPLSAAGSIDELCDLVLHVDWGHRTTWRTDRLELLQAAAVIARIDDTRGIEVRQVYEEVRASVNTDAPIMRQGESRLRLLERAYIGIADAALDQGMGATARLRAAVSGWLGVGCAWRAAEAAYYLARYTLDPSDITSALALLETWPESPYRSSLLRLSAG